MQPIDEDARSLAGDVHHLDRPALVRSAELLRGRSQQGGDDQGTQHHPSILGNDRERNWAETFETARICLADRAGRRRADPHRPSRRAIQRPSGERTASRAAPLAEQVAARPARPAQGVHGARSIDVDDRGPMPSRRGVRRARGRRPAARPVPAPPRRDRAAGRPCRRRRRPAACLARGRRSACRSLVPPQRGKRTSGRASVQRTVAVGRQRDELVRLRGDDEAAERRPRRLAVARRAAASSRPRRRPRRPSRR